MSEYQYVYFAAVDRPLDDEQLEYMERQSSRAQISRWQFTNEYHYGGFHGQTEEMLRRGYDVHLHYANYGTRRLMFRLPSGLPWTKKVYSAYQQRHGVEWKQDKGRKTGTLRIEPELDGELFDKNFFEFESITEALPRIRDLLIRGDLRPLYLVWLACRADEQVTEPPVPGGLGDLPAELESLCQFYEISRDLVEAAAESSPTAPDSTDEKTLLQQWLGRRDADDLRQLTRGLLGENSPTIRAETLARIRRGSPSPAWPTRTSGRTVGVLRTIAERHCTRRAREEETQRVRARKKRWAAIAADPDKAIARVRELVKSRSTANYQQAAKELADLREALGSRGEERARAVAAELIRKHPTIRGLKTALRDKGLLQSGATLRVAKRVN